MARSLFNKEMTENPVTGRQIIDIVTTGMYSNPLMVLREYVQNATDAIDEAITKRLLRSGEGRIDIDVDGFSRRISILDNGIGIEPGQIIKLLCGLGLSSKEPTQYRGFRGIGRLGGVGYSDTTIFETRGPSGSSVAVVTWNGKLIRESIASSPGHKDIETLLKEAVKLTWRRPKNAEDSHFFKVTLVNIRKFHRDELMDLSTIRRYLGQVAPVPFCQSFLPLSSDIERHLNDINGYRAYNILVNGEQLFRPHTVQFAIREKKIDTIRGIELFDFKTTKGQLFARGWFAQTSYLASLPIAVAMRGIRVRQGNIEIGNEYFLENLYSERRFSTWHIGEIHVSYTLKTNARRDGFEQSSAFESFLERATSLTRHLSSLCRSSSKHRSDDISTRQALKKLERLLALPYYVDPTHREKSEADVEMLLASIEKRIDGNNGSEMKKQLAIFREAHNYNGKGRPILMDVLDGRKLRHIKNKVLFNNIVEAILANDNKEPPETLIRLLAEPYLKNNL
jgi:hypothetical protein